MITLTVDKYYHLNLQSDISISEGSDVNIVVVFADDFPSADIINAQIEYRNGKFKKREYITKATPVVISEPFNKRGYLDLQLICDTYSAGIRKTNTQTAKIHRSINACPVDRDLEELYELIRNLQNKDAAQDARIAELETQTNTLLGAELRFDQKTQILQLINLEGEVISETSLNSLVAISSIEWSEEYDAYVLTKTDETTEILNIPARVE